MVTRTFVLQKEVLFTFIFFSCNFYELRLAANDFFFVIFQKSKEKILTGKKRFLMNYLEVEPYLEISWKEYKKDIIINSNVEVK